MLLRWLWRDGAVRGSKRYAVGMAFLGRGNKTDLRPDNGAASGTLLFCSQRLERRAAELQGVIRGVHACGVLGAFVGVRLAQLTGRMRVFFFFFFPKTFPPGFHSCTEHHAGRSIGREAGSGRRDARVSPDTTACSMPCPPAPGGCLIRSRVRD